MTLLSARQKIVASNIANADTPGYKTQDIDFQSELQSALSGQSPAATEVSGLRVKNDGNNVSLDRESRLLAETAMRFNVASNLLRSQLKHGRRRDVVFQPESVSSPFSSVFQTQLGNGPQGVSVSDIIVDNSDPERRYLPNHPDADKDGYVAFPKVNPAEDMVDLMGASRSYQANVSAISAVKDMINKSIDLFR